MRLSEDFRTIAKQIGHGSMTQGVKVSLEEAARERGLWIEKDEIKKKRLGKNESLLWRNISGTVLCEISPGDLIRISSSLGLHDQSKKLTAHLVDKNLLVKLKNRRGYGINRGAQEYVEVQE